MPTLKPINKRDTWALPLERVVALSALGFFAALPLAAPKPQIPQMASPLERALYDGSMTLIGGLFRGRLSAGISRELSAMGGQYIGVSGGWQVPIENIPYRIRRAAEAGREARGAWLTNLQSALKTVVPPATIGIEVLLPIFRDLANKVTVEFKKTTGFIPSVGDIEKRAQEFAERVDSSVVGFTETEKRVLTRLVQTAVDENWSMVKLQKTLEGRRGIGREKAKIVARQGMSETVTSIKSEYYVAAGFPTYIWKTKGDSRVRPDHSILDGKVCEWQNPPVVDLATGYRGHPGQAAHCRCEAIPVKGD